MADLEFRIGCLEIEKSKITDDQYRPHRFITEARDNVVYFYGCFASSHYQVADRFNVNWKEGHKIVGGGSFDVEIDKRTKKLKLVLSGQSIDYSGIHPYAARKFARLILPRLNEQGIKLANFQVVPPSGINRYWARRY